MAFIIDTTSNNLFQNKQESYEIESIVNQVTWDLRFLDSSKEIEYMKSLKYLLYFHTFSILIFIFISISIAQCVALIPYFNLAISITITFNIITSLSLILYLVSQASLSYPNYFNKHFLEVSRYILGGRNRIYFEDLIMILSTFSNILYLLSLSSKDLCMGCHSLFSVTKCIFYSERFYPINQSFFCYLCLLVFPIFFKCIHRYVLVFCWFIISLSSLMSLIIGSYKPEPLIVISALFFLICITEIERYKIFTFLLSKNELAKEQSKVSKMTEKSKIIERKLHLALVHQILPKKVANQIISGKQVEPEMFNNVTIFFSDVVGFTTICSKVTPIEVVQMLNNLYSVMDYCSSLFPLYKVETIGDAYMVVGGLPERDENHARQVADFALLVRRAVQAVKSPVDGNPINIRIGIHSGPVMAGVVGNLMPRYCLFGDTVNTASRMESNGESGKIHCSADTYNLLSSNYSYYTFECRGEIDVKGKGKMKTYWLLEANNSNERANEEAIVRTVATANEVLASSSYNKDKEFCDTTEIVSEFDDEATPLIPQSGTADDFGTGLFSNSNAEIAPSSSLEDFSVYSENQESSIQSGSISKPSSGSMRGSISTRIGIDEYGKIISNKAKILVVEDSPPQRKMLIKRLRKANPSWEIYSAENGEEALQKIKLCKMRFDIVFVDENLSHSDGLYGHELIQVMRKSYGMYNTLVIACTSNSTKVSKRLIEAGVDVIWEKPPPKSEEVRVLIDELLEKKYSELKSISIAGVGMEGNRDYDFDETKDQGESIGLFPIKSLSMDSIG